MPDLVHFNGNWLCVLREKQQPSSEAYGVIRLISSADGLVWDSSAYFSDEAIDFCYPTLSSMPDGRLLLLVNAVVHNPANKHKEYRSYVAFSVDGSTWSPFKPILSVNEWLPRLIWFQGQAFGVVHSYQKPSDLDEQSLKLYITSNGIDYELVAHLDIPGQAIRGVLAVLGTGQMVGLFQREKPGDNYAWVGSTYFPFVSWNWKVAQYYIGDPNIIVQADQSMWAAGRIWGMTPYGNMEKLALLRFDLDSLEPILILPSGGDTGNPGLVYHDTVLWVSYYSSHEGKQAIYLAQIKLPGSK